MIPKTKKRKAAPGPYRSKSEARIAAALGNSAQYESVRFPYPSKPRTYLVDFILSNGILIEVKGWFTGADRAKMKAVKSAHPDLDIRLVLDTPHQWTTKNKTMTNAEWCEKNGFPWAAKQVPESWLYAPRNEKSLDAMVAGGIYKRGLLQPPDAS